MNSLLPFEVVSLLVFSTAIQWVLAACLWLVWRQEPTQVFARLVALAYFCSGGLVLCYALFRVDTPGVRALGITLACLMSAGFFHGMTVGLRDLAGRPMRPAVRVVGVIAPTLLACASLIAAEIRIVQGLVIVYNGFLGVACMVWLRQASRLERWIGPVTLLIALNQLPWLLVGEAALQLQLYGGAILRVVLASLITIAALGRASAHARESESRFRALLDAVPQVMTVARMEDGVIVQVNPAFERATGLLAEQVVGRPVTSIGTWARPEEREHLLQALRQHGGVQGFEHDAITPAGTRRVSVWAAVFQLDGKPHSLSLTQDVTEQRRNEQALRHTNAMHKALFQAMPEYVTISELTTGKLLEVSSGFEEVIGWTRQEALGRTSTELGIVTPEFREVFRTALRQSQGRVRRIEGHLVHKDGRTLVLEASLSVYEVDGQQYLASIATDVTESRRREAALRASESRYALIFDLVPEYVVLARKADGRLVQVNRGFEQVTGWTRAEAVGRTTIELGLLAPSERERLLQAVQAGQGQVSNLDLEIHGRDGGALQTLYSANVIHHDGEDYLLAVVRDVTEERRREAQLRDTLAAKQAAEVANQLKSDFLAMISHEVRTPLGGVIGMLQFALKDAHLNPGTQEKLAIGLNNAETLLQIINDILDFSKLQAGKMPLEHIHFRLATVVRDAVSILEDRAESKGLSLVAEVDAVLAPWWQGDPTRLRQVLINLMGNAIKFTQQGEVRLVVRPGAGGGLEFQVCDTGIGIAPEALQRLFLKFEQADASTARRFGGTGLGLAICKTLVEAMGGTIAVSSTLGLGTTFTVALPLSTGSPTVEATSDSAAPHTRSLRVLCAEDGFTNQVILRELITSMGHIFSLAEDGEAALVAMAQTDFDVLVLDSRMPRLDGIDVLRILRAGERPVRNTRMPVIACTTNAGADERERFLAAGAQDFLPKPVDEAALHAALARVIAMLDNADALPTPPTPALAATARNPMAATAAMRLAFISEGPRMVGALRDATAAADAQACARAAHGIKGSAGYFGATELQKLARQAEHSADSGQLDALPALVAAIANGMDHLVAQLQPWAAHAEVAGPAPNATVVLDREQLHVQLAQLDALLARQSLDAQNLADRLPDQLPDGPARDTAHSLAQQLAQFDFAGARSALATLRATLESTP